ncbi:MAG TPA: pseudouridine synthase [Pyrinomonadaceae bacterium]|jgi:pseudouridine synthase|nr:pseudouridine synthase [Pyrinomonadaceae bacterium]
MQTRLQKIIASAGIASRRHAEDLITSGKVSVNGKVINKLGAKADPDRDHIKVNGRLINQRLQRPDHLYILLNKPKGYLTSMSDPAERPLVIDLIPKSLGRLHPVGRLDFNTEGLLLLTTDGELTNIVTSAKNQIAKIYKVKVKGTPSDKAIERLRRGVVIEEGERTARAEVRKLRHSENNSWFEVKLFEGRNQQVRRMFDAIGHSVVKLTRTQIGSLEIGTLPVGHWRHLTEREVAHLKRVHAAKGIKESSQHNRARMRRPRHSATMSRSH